MTKDTDGKTTVFANEEYEERAAILQYDAGMSKAEAEKKAKALIEKRKMLDKIEKMRENKH